MGVYHHKTWILGEIPPGKLTLLWKITICFWVNPLFQWPVSMAMLIYQRVSTTDFSISMLNGSSNAIFLGVSIVMGVPQARWMVYTGKSQTKTDEHR